MKITLKLYAHLGDLLPPGAYQNKSVVEVADDVSLNEIIDDYKIPRPMAHLVLLNGIFICDTDRDQRGQIKADDTLAIWPPVAGG
uniref:Molybdopterin converting factor, small subunit n=1 Tax=uncultured Thiotrichaceae bacterium TaxID=298394 RepID=A0A6S6U8D7_9GAMM|nr:MAG: Molybdopterin converting factor, small subunit [uncultured Thiotrichaceae bacterium]